MREPAAEEGDAARQPTSTQSKTTSRSNTAARAEEGSLPGGNKRLDEHALVVHREASGPFRCLSGKLSCITTNTSGENARTLVRVNKED